MWISDRWKIRGAGLGIGLVYAAGNLNGWLAPLQWLAIGFLGWIALRRPPLGRMILLGLYMGLGYTMPQLVSLRMPVPITVALLLDLTMVMLMMALAAGLFLRHRSVSSVFATAATFCLLDWANYTLLPIWGTAQSIVRCWSAWPLWIGFSAWTGISGIGFVNTVIVLLIVTTFSVPMIRTQTILGGIVVLGFVLTGNILGPSVSTESLRVAGVGFNSRDSKGSELDDDRRFQQCFIEPMMRAGQGGARLAVFPEMAFEFGQSERNQWIHRFCQTAQQYHIAVIVGIYDCSFNENRILFINSEGDLVGQYTKIHLTPFEPFVKGTGRLIQMDIDGIKIGGMICHDDNFTDLSRQYGRKGIQLVAVPTMDWQTVRNPHLQSSIHRAIESGYAVVRAVTDGITSVIGPDGRVIARVDPLRNSETILLADVPCGQGDTFYSRFGNLIIPFSGIVVALHSVRLLIRRILM